MKKKIALGLGVLVVAVAGVVAMSAFEAHVINVTAHVENALSVDPHELDFGTVFPQEYLEKSFTISLSESFQMADRVDDVGYVIKQKPKCECEYWGTAEENLCTEGQYAPVDYVTHGCPTNYKEMEDLCRFLSKMPQDENETEIGEPSYYDPGTDSCLPLVRDAVQASGKLAKSEQDFSDTWIVDLKVPPIAGFVGQDWPESCAGWVVDQNDMDYGCDLWVEVTEISLPPDRFPLEGTAYIGYEDWTDGDLDYNDFGMDFYAQEFYDTVGPTDYLTRVVMSFEAVIYDSGANHYIHIKRPFSGSYTYNVTRSVSALASEVAAGVHSGSGDLDVVLFDTAKYTWPEKQIGETVMIEVILDDPLANPRTPLTAPRPDLDPFMANYDPWENPYAGVSGIFHIAHIETIGSTAAQKNTPRIVPVGTEVPFILVIPETDWIPPYEDTTITAPYWHFTDYYDGLATGWGPGWEHWYLSLDPAHSFVGTGGLAW